MEISPKQATAMACKVATTDRPFLDKWGPVVARAEERLEGRTAVEIVALELLRAYKARCGVDWHIVAQALVDKFAADREIQEIKLRSLMGDGGLRLSRSGRHESGA